LEYPLIERAARPVVVLIAGAALAAPVVATQVPADAAGIRAPSGVFSAGKLADGREGEPGSNAGPPYNYETELMGEDGPATPLKDSAILERTEHGYRFRSGQQNGHLVVTRVDGGLRFADTGTASFKQPPAAACQRKKVRVGIAAVCRIPGGLSVAAPLLIEVWPRLGNDYTDTSTLPATFAATALGDAGRDVAHFGAGPDFFNGFSSRDVVTGGAGNDWIRSGIGNDAVDGGPGNDDIVAKEGSDTVHGGDGDDRLWAGDGDDHLGGGAGADFLLCGNGRDSTDADGSDRVSRDCES
jgi:Ca2+-binding RTX toxin-like protein